MNSKWLLVSIWGDPGNWFPVQYSAPNIPDMKSCKLSSISLRESNGRKCKSTLGALMSAYDHYISEAIVYLADTLALSPYVFMYKNSKNKCRFLNSYQDILECIKQYISNVLSDEEYVEEVFRDRIKTHILPSVGVYERRRKDLGDGLKAQYIGSPLNYYYGLLIHLYEYLTSISEDIDTLLLDISHGVNFMPVLGFRAVIEALRLYLARSGKDKIRLIVLNSDPVVPGVLMDIPRSINIVYCREFTREEVLAEIIQRLRELDAVSGGKPYIMLRKEKPPNSIRKLNEIHNSIYKNILEPAKIILKSIDRGLPLPLAYTIEELKKIKPNEIYLNLISVLKDFLSNRTIVRKNDRIVVEHSAALSNPIELYLEVLAILNTLADYIREELESIDESISYAGKIKGIKMYSLHSLRGLSDKYMVSRAARELVGNEVSNIEDRTRLYEGLCGKISKPILYKCIYDFTERELHGVKLIQYYREEEDVERVRKLVEGKITCPCIEECLREASNIIDNIRNFYAHAGFYAPITLIAVKNGRVYVGYMPGINYKDVILRN